MRPDDRRSAFDELIEPGMDLPFDADLESLDEELVAAGQHARRMLHGRTQPTRLFSNQLRAHLLGTGARDAGKGAAVALPAGVPDAGGAERSVTPGLRGHRAEPAPSARAVRRPTEQARPGRPAFARPPLSLPARPLLALLAIAGMAGVLALGALGGTFGPPLP